MSGRTATRTKGALPRRARAEFHPTASGGAVALALDAKRGNRSCLELTATATWHGDDVEAEQGDPGACHKRSAAGVSMSSQENRGGDMASNARVPEADITGIYGFLLKMMSRKMFGHVPASAGVMWHYPAVLKDGMGFAREADKWNRLDPNLASFAAMATASVVGCSFCLDLNYFMAHNRGLDETKVREVQR